MTVGPETVPTARTSIGAVVQAWRSYRGMTGSELAQKAELDKSYVWQLERDYIKQPRGAILERIAAALRVRVETLTLREMPPLEPRATTDLGAPPPTVPVSWALTEAEDTEPVPGLDVRVKAWFVRKHADQAERATYPIRGRITSIGREQTQADIVLSEPYVSRVHARIVEAAPGEYWLYDGSPQSPSKNGTLVNDERLPPGGCRKLRSGDMVRLGDTFLEFYSLQADAAFEDENA